VWAASASTFAGYYYLLHRDRTEQLDSTQNSLSKLASSYNEAVNKYNLLLSDYSSLHSSYLLFTDSNYASLIKPFENLLANFAKNYTRLLAQEDLNKTYNRLLSNCTALEQRGSATKEDLRTLLSDYYNLFNVCALRELGLSISETTMLSVSVCVDYKNGTVEWHNKTLVSAGYTLFRLTQKIASIDYDYYASMEPGHILVRTINGKANYVDSSFSWGNSWIWYYWSESQLKWVSGPVGCDAWLLKDGGIYKWSYEYWSFP
jgi:hypothetical protein